MGLFVIALWLTRKHLKGVFVEAWGGRVNTQERTPAKTEPMSSRTALIGLILGFSFLAVFCIVAGMSFWIALSFLVLLIGLETAITRMRAELGPPIHEINRVGPDFFLATALGTRRLGGKNLTMLTYLYFTDRNPTSHPMPHQLEGFKLAEHAGINSKRLAAAMMIAVAVGVISALWALRHAAYDIGVASGFAGFVGIPGESFPRLASWIQYPSNTNSGQFGFIGIGFLFSLLLIFLRSRFLWWPLHPVGYALSTSGWVINYIWFSFMVSWFIKWTILRHGHLKAYRNTTPFFFGLILGEYATGCSWNLLGIVLGLPTYGFFE